MLNLITNRSRLKHRNFCTIRNYELDKHLGVCSNQSTIEMYFDWYNNDLEKEITRRSQQQVRTTTNAGALLRIMDM
jgi:hypothetical protein